jgi:CHAT domain
MKRRALLLASLASLTGCGWAHGAALPDMGHLARLYRANQGDVRQALTWMRQRQWLRAIPLLQAAQARIDAEPEMGWPLRLYILPPLGACLLAVQQHPQALAALQQAQEAEARITAGEAGPQLAQILRGLNARFVTELMKLEFTRQMLGDVESRQEMGGLPVDELLHDVRLGAHNADIPLVRALARLGQREALQARYARAHWPSPGQADTGEAWSPHWAGEEYRAAQYGMALTAVGAGDLAGKALGHALSLNWQRCVQFGSHVPSVQAHAGVFSMRRLLLGLSLGLYFAQPDARTALPSATLLARMLETKGLGLRHGAQLNRLMAHSSHPLVQQAREAMRQQEARLHAGLARGLALPELILAQSSAMGTLATAMPLLREQGLAEVFVPGERVLDGLRRIPVGAACMGFVSHRPQTEDGRALAPARYARWTWMQGAIGLHDLGPCQVIDEAIVRLRTQLSSGTSRMPVDLSALSRLLLSNLPPTVAQATRWFIEPDGALSLLPFELLSIQAGRPLIDHCCISLVSSFGQWLLAGHPAATGPACVVANPAYPDNPVASPLRGRIHPLPETAVEARAVQTAMQRMGQTVRLFEGPTATPSALVCDPAPRMLHVAAHGLMLDTGAPEALSDTGREMLSVVLPGRGAALALAGPDGATLVYGTDLMALNLRGTELAVLSACDTGNGRIEAGEGLDSLRRALETAGVRATVTSLWPVPSEATVHLMSAFYQALSEGQAVAPALRQAKLTVRKAFPQPEAWAGFVAAGQA